MERRRPELPQALPVAPREAIPTTPRGIVDMLCAVLSQKDEELRAWIQHYGADRTARARRAGSAPKQKSATKRDERVEVWLAEMEYRMQHGGRVGKGYIDQIVADRFGVDQETIKRARLKAGYK
jgi:hypothetical protein